MADNTDNANEGGQQGHGTEIPDPHDESAEASPGDGRAGDEPAGTPADANQQEQIASLLSEHNPSEEGEDSGEKSLDDVLDQGERTSEEETDEVDEQEQQRQGRDEGTDEPEQRSEEQEEPDTDQETPDELAEIREELRETKKELARLKQEGEEEETQEETQEEEAEEQIRDFDEVDFVTDEEFEEVTEDPESFNEFLQAFASSIKESVLRDIPGIVEKTTQRQVTYQQAISNFWEEHPELQEHQDFVQFTANQVEAENPEMNVPEMLDETARRVKEELAIKEQAEQRESQRQEGEAGSQSGQSDSQTRSPSTARKPRGSRGGVGGEDNRGEQQQQIDSLISDEL